MHNDLPPPPPPPTPPGHVQQLTTQVAHLDVFSHVVECIFFLQQDNVICQVLIDSWGESNNLCTIYVLLTVPLDTLTVTYSETYDAQPLSNAYENQITHFQNMYDHCSCQTAWSGHNIFDLTSSHFDSYCFLISHNHDWLPPALMLLHVIESLGSHQSVLMVGRSQEHSPVLNPFLRNHTTFMTK